jgi:hypothetical protein
MKTIAFILSAAAAAFCTSVSAEAFRCNGDLAALGESKSSVLYKCGQPYFVESYCRPRGAIRADPPEDMTWIVPPCEQWDLWSYNPGSGQFITTLHFREGTLTTITYGDRIK